MNPDLTKLQAALDDYKQIVARQGELRTDESNAALQALRLELLKVAGEAVAAVKTERARLRALIESIIPDSPQFQVDRLTQEIAPLAPELRLLQNRAARLGPMLTVGLTTQPRYVVEAAENALSTLAGTRP